MSLDAYYNQGVDMLNMLGDLETDRMTDQHEFDQKSTGIYRHYRCGCGFKWESFSDDTENLSVDEECGVEWCGVWVTPWAYESVESNHSRAFDLFFVRGGRRVPDSAESKQELMGLFD
jgi:hypothetical protein